MRKFYLVSLAISLLSFKFLFSQVVFNPDPIFPDLSDVDNATFTFYTCSGNTNVTYPTITAVPSPTSLGAVVSVYLVSGPAQGTNEPVGTYTVTWGANYTCGALLDQLCTATCSFTVKVIKVDPITIYADLDGDGYGDPTKSLSWCPVLFDGSIATSPPFGASFNGTDCNDNDATVWRQATIYIDHDGDGYDNGSTTVCYGNTLQVPAGYSATTVGHDCNDNDPAIHSSVISYLDADRDGYGDPLNFTIDGCNVPPGYVTNNGDCNDQDPTIHAPVTYYRDADRDSYGDPNNSISVCSLTPPTGYVTNNYDCNDADPKINPTTQWVLDADGDHFYVGNIITQCSSPGAGYVDIELVYAGNGVFLPDEAPGDCNDQDPTVHSPITYYRDVDGDGYGDPNNTTSACSSTAPGGYVSNNADCNDNDPAINPTTVWYKDADNDGYSDGTKVIQCLKPSGYKLATELIATSGDCNDNNPILSPATVWYKDLDNDGYSDGVQIVNCLRPPGFKLAIELTGTSGDCNDNDPTVNPGAVEVCGNGIDDNCNGVIDEKACYACQNGTNLTTTNITSSSAQFNWSSIPNSRQWQIEYKSTAPGTKWIDILLTGNLRSTPLAGLKASTNYQWHMRAMCGKNWTDYSVAITFKTLGNGAAETSAMTRAQQTPELADLQVKALPNPSNTNFTVTVKGNGQAGGVKMIVVDIDGRIIEQRTLLNEQTFTIGDRYFPGIYILRFMQGEQSQQLKLIKMSQ